MNAETFEIRCVVDISWRFRSRSGFRPRATGKSYPSHLKWYDGPILIKLGRSGRMILIVLCPSLSGKKNWKAWQFNELAFHMAEDTNSSGSILSAADCYMT